MSKMISMSVISFLLVVSFTACTKKPVNKEQVVTAVTEALCKKMLECQPNSMPSAEYCNTMLKNAISGTLSAMPEVGTTEQKLTACTKSITSVTCEGLNSPTPPKDCDFLQPKSPESAPTK